jgi:hypothetical protein
MYFLESLFHFFLNWILASMSWVMAAGLIVNAAIGVSYLLYWLLAPSDKYSIDKNVSYHW